MDPNDARLNLLALARAEARRTPTPGVRRWFVVLPIRNIEQAPTMRISVIRPAIA